jgi:RNA polymerase subunit RPABC4/transcription elongation factor Spt4
MSKPLPPPAECANCGAAIPRNAKACPECGADERTGWRETSVYDDLDLPEAAWEENENEKLAHSRNTLRVNGIPWYWWCVGVVLAGLLVAGFIRFS